MHESDPRKLGDEKDKHLAGKDQDRQTHPEDAPGWNETLAVSDIFAPSLNSCRNIDDRRREASWIIVLPTVQVNPQSVDHHTVPPAHVSQSDFTRPAS
jgi:hypothetical protein